jgi:outer membrane lipoprotein-sorting protein
MKPGPKTILRRLKQVSEIEPQDEAVERALGRARAKLARLAAEPARAIPQDKENFFGSKRMFPQIAKVALTCAALVGLLVVFTFPGGQQQLAFAQVAEKVQKTQSLSFKAKCVRLVPESEGDRMLILPDGKMRAENSKVYSIQDVRGHKMILVDKTIKTAHLFEGFAPPEYLRDNLNAYDLIKNVRKEAVRRLPDEEIDGRKAAVFRAELTGLPMPEKKMVWKVWVDPKTELPIRMEDTEKDEHGKPVTFVMYDIEFDRPFDPSLFSFEPPKGYKVETSGTANFPDLPDKPDLRAPRIIPGVGLGPVRFDMSREEIEKLLGKPDGYSADKTKLGYMSRGFVLTVSHRTGLKNISCVSQELSMERVRDFAGKTNEGIGIGASLKEVEKAFGKPDRDDGHNSMNKRLVYDKLGLEIQFVEDKVITIDLSKVRRRPTGPANAANQSPGAKPPVLRDLQISVVGPDDKPLPGARIHIAIWAPNPAKLNRNFECDARGQAVIKFPRDFTILRLWVRRDGCVPLFVHWEEMDENPPDSFTIKLAKGTAIGGFVKDEQGRPIAGAKVEVAWVPRDYEQSNRTCICNRLAEDDDDARVTDAAGRWSLDNVPAGGGSLSIKISHPAYLDDTNFGGLQEKQHVTQESLRNQKATIVLRRKSGAKGP